MMARKPNDIEDLREIEEGNLACLGNAIVLLDLVDERVAVAVQISRQAGLLGPARGDLRRIRALLRMVQGRLAGANK
jgi:hypothetical protein